MSLSQSLQNFRDTILTINGLIVSAHAIDAATGKTLWSANETAFITESAFFKMFIAWETFLEESFILYLTGNQSISGTVVRKYANPVDEAHAHKFLIGNMKFVDWSDPKKVITLAEIYFDAGEPYKTAINSIHSHLQDLKTIRNAAAHLSSTTTGQLDALAIRKLGRPYTRISVYNLITTVDLSSPSKTIIQGYQDILDAAADIIAKN